MVGEGEEKLADKALYELSWFIEDPAGCTTFVGPFIVEWERRGLSK